MSTHQSIPAHLPRLANLYDLPDSEIQERAARNAARVQRLADLWSHHGTEPGRVLQALRKLAQRHGVRMPNKTGAAAAINRMSDAAWWRRAMRSRFKAVELHEIQRGTVHKRASPCVSAKGLRRHRANSARLEGQMQALEAVNQTTGEALPMPELIEASLANPAHRRRALMARIKGIEQWANSKGHQALFLTITCPSRMHPRSSATGAPNPNYDGTFPTRAHSYLCGVWGRANRRAAHLGLSAYGLRVVEAHHDACPHWHLLVFVHPDHAEAYTANLRAYALADSPNELGAQVHRFKVEVIDPTKGSAVGYVAKYVSKCIDGHGVDQDRDTGADGADTATRQVAWARTWSIRQFQFFGVPAITPTRELYRLDGATLPGEALPKLHAACKANDYAAWLSTVEAHGLSLSVAYSERESTRYRGEVSKAIQGLSAQGGDLIAPLAMVTRCDTWRIQSRPKRREEGRAHAAPVPPWTRFNNSAPIDLKGLFPSTVPEEGHLKEEGEVLRRTREKCPAPGTATRCRTRAMEVTRRTGYRPGDTAQEHQTGRATTC